MTSLNAAILIAVSAAVTFLTRALPFVIFKGQAVIPKWLSFLGKALPGSVMAVLVVYCLRNVSFASAEGFLPALIGVAVVSLLHSWKRNNLLSIGGGTLLYMFLVQVIF